MDCFIKKIWEGKTQDDEAVHMQFSKFSKGEFKNKAMIKARNSSGTYSISTTPEYASELARWVAEKLIGPVRVTGIVVSTRDLKEELDFQDKKQFMGVKQYVLDKDMTKEEIISICEKFPRSFIGLSFSSGDTDLKVKTKAPKSAKPSTKAEETPKIDFCKLKTKDKDLVKSLIFDYPDFKQAEIKHTFIIEEIVISEDLKKETDFAKIREMAKRKGKIIRELDIDGKKMKEEKEFEAL
jgi:hypothetical protein